MGNHLDLTNVANDIRSLQIVAVLRPNITLYLLNNFEYWLKENLFEQQFTVRKAMVLLFNWHCVETIGISVGQRKEFFVKVPSRRSDENSSRLSSSSTPIVAMYYLTSRVRKILKICRILSQGLSTVRMLLRYFGYLRFPVARLITDSFSNASSLFRSLEL